MSIEIIKLTEKGESLAISRGGGSSQKELWNTIYFIARMGKQTTNDKITTMVFGGDERAANKAIGYLKSKNIVVGE